MTKGKTTTSQVVVVKRQPESKKERKQVIRPMKELVTQQTIKVAKGNKPTSQMKNKQVSKTRAGKMVKVNASDSYRRASEIVAMITLPGYGPTVRWNNQFSQKKTAVAAPFQILQGNWGQTPTGTPPGVYTQQMLQTEMASIQFRNPLRASIVYDQNSSYQAASYLGTFGGNTSQTYLLQVGTQDITPDVTTYTAQSTYKPHGSILYLGTVSDRDGKFVWIDQGQQLNVSISMLTTLSSGTTCVVQSVLDKFDSNGFTPDAQNVSITFTSSSATGPIIASFQTLTSGYYCYKFSALLNQAGSPNPGIVINSMSLFDLGTSHFCHLPLPGLNNNLAVTHGMRMLGCSMMYTNTSANIQLGGQISGFQSGTDDNWLNYITKGTNGTFGNISSLEDSATMNMSTGFYGFLKPTDGRDFEFKDSAQVNPNGVVVETSYPIDSCDSFLFFVGQSPNALGCSGYYTFKYAIEYFTTDTWRDLEVSVIDEDVVNRALARVKDVGQFYENPLHIMGILQGIRNVVSTVAKGIVDYGPSVIRGAQWVADRLG